MKETTAICVSNYINEHTSIEINGKKVKFSLDESKTDHGHFVLYMKSELKSPDVSEIKIKNECFYEFDSKYKNRLIMNVAQFQKSYLLTKGKDKIHLK